MNLRYDGILKNPPLFLIQTSLIPSEIRLKFSNYGRETFNFWQHDEQENTKMIMLVN